MQEIWIAGTDWDDLLSDGMTRKINLWFIELGQLQNLKVPRCLQQSNEAIKINLHIFADVSQGAYGAVTYLRTEYKEQTIAVIFVAAKTKVAPLQSVSEPRMELMGACLGVKLAQSIVKALSYSMLHVTFWLDSTSVLWWIRGRLAPNMLKNLPIIPSRTSQNFYPLFFFIPMVPPIIPFLFFSVNDNITVQE